MDGAAVVRELGRKQLTELHEVLDRRAVAHAAIVASHGRVLVDNNGVEVRHVDRDAPAQLAVVFDELGQRVVHLGGGDGGHRHVMQGELVRAQHGLHVDLRLAREAQRGTGAGQPRALHTGASLHRPPVVGVRHRAEERGPISLGLAVLVTAAATLLQVTRPGGLLRRQ
jgi:hypothetical protein